MTKIWALLTGQKIVYLKDHDGTITKTVAKETPFGLVAKRMWPFNIRNVLLLPGGKVENGVYVIEWRSLNCAKQDTCARGGKQEN